MHSNMYDEFLDISQECAVKYLHLFHKHQTILVGLGLLFLASLLLLRKWNRMVVGNLQDKYVLVTGCDSGFGHLVVQKLDAMGVNVIAGCLTEKGMADVRAKTSKKTVTIRLDITDKSSIQNCYNQVKKIVPEKQGLWGLVNNAGILGNILTEFATPEDYRKVMEVNFFGMVEMTYALLPFLRRARGRIVNVSSIAGRAAVNGGPYPASKFAVEAYSDGIRRSFQNSGVKVSTLEPGFFTQTSIMKQDTLEKEFYSYWDKLAPELQEQYGEGYKHALIKTFLASVKLMPLTRFNRIEMVPDTMIEALTVRNPKARYIVGLDAYVVFLPLTIVPDFIFDLFMHFAYPTPPRLN